ncbi:MULTISPECIES: hypothetical protein [Methylomonas]|uniref:Uncharacterized protein n=1 Tax=Methylomonas defluvii TaxID=3045149 RepID=A0ABU4UBI0_9GAMM|nr:MULTISPECIES: hypothetical protein [Methylomonas]ATG92536.1 hypothetical protein MKLM6_4375 [Methylomonas koyamae]MDX8126814.1 hypothetical protein [Methylomonas sp. OY6]
MIRYIYPDGGEGYEYQVGDLVIVTPDHYNQTRCEAEIEAIGEVVSLLPFIDEWNRHTGTYLVRSPVFYGADKCVGYQLRPTAETIKVAELIFVDVKTIPKNN